MGVPAKPQALWGEEEQGNAVRDGRKAVKSAFALLSQKVTKAAAGAAKGGFDLRKH